MEVEAVFDYYAIQAQKSFNLFRQRCAHPLAFGAWIANTYRYVVQTVPVMREVARSCGHEELRLVLERKAAEEVGHDELLLSDLSALGYNLSDFQASPHMQRLCVRERELLVASKPAVAELIGYMIVLEVMHPSPCDVDRIVHEFSVPSNAASAFRSHAELDFDHSRSVISLFENPAILRSQVYSSGICVLQNFRDHWLWMARQYEKHSIEVL